MPDTDGQTDRRRPNLICRRNGRRPRNKEMVHDYFLESYERTEALWDLMREEGMVSDESWRVWRDDRPDRLRRAEG